MDEVYVKQWVVEEAARVSNSLGCVLVVAVVIVPLAGAATGQGGVSFL